MNVVPQDSTAPQRPNVEGLRSYSDQNTAILRPGNINPQPRRDITRRHNHDATVRVAPTNNGSPYYSYAVPQVPSPRYANTGNVQYPIPQRRHSLLHGFEQANTGAPRRVMTTMSGQQIGHEQHTDIGGRRMNNAAYTHGRTASLSSIPYPGRLSSSTSSIYPTRTTSHQPTTVPANEGRHRDVYTLPRWQPDAEVTHCPICQHIFTFLYRKHHCRKCGRVVCGNCSPHRITIPRQYIVNPPSVHPVEIDLTGGSVEDNNTAPRLAADQLHLPLDGGQEVRLCNPCVPDPNPSPPSQLYARSSNTLPISEPVNVDQTSRGSHPSSLRRTGRSGSASSNYARYHEVQSNPLMRHRVAYQPQQNLLSSQSAVPYGSAPDSPATYLSRYGPIRTHRQHGSLSVLPMPPRRSMFDDMTTPEPPLESSPRRQIAEEDECPICHEELPPKGPDGSEIERESHITSCIETHFSSSRPKNDLITRPDASVTEASTTSTQTVSSLSNSTSVGPSSRKRIAGMVVYHATEKDCIGEDGTPQECIICFEDFETGTEMGRLECLCKFHKACIRSWWDTKGNGACPVHQGGLI